MKYMKVGITLTSKQNTTLCFKLISLKGKKEAFIRNE